MFSVNDDPDRKISGGSYSDRAYDYAYTLELQRRMRDRLARLSWERRQQAFSLSPAERRQILSNGLDASAKHLARQDFRRLNRKL